MVKTDNEKKLGNMLVLSEENEILLPKEILKISD